MLRERGEALAGVDREFAVLFGELLIHDGLGAAQDRPNPIRDHKADDYYQHIVTDVLRSAHRPLNSRQKALVSSQRLLRSEL
jgi:hypothetical protein